MKALDEQKLTKREQLLMQRKKQAEQLIAWKERLDREERQVRIPEAPPSLLQKQNIHTSYLYCVTWSCVTWPCMCNVHATITKPLTVAHL